MASHTSQPKQGHNLWPVTPPNLSKATIDGQPNAPSLSKAPLDSQLF